MDRQSGKKVEISLNRHELLKQLSTKAEPLRIVTAAPSGEIFKYDIRATASDTDMLYHVNQANWVNYCMDATAEGVLQGRFRNFKNDPFTYHTKEVKILYSAEGFPGDVLTVSIWEDQETDDTLFFEVNKGDKQCVSCSIKFYKNPGMTIRSEYMHVCV